MSSWRTGRGKCGRVFWTEWLVACHQDRLLRISLEFSSPSPKPELLCEAYPIKCSLSLTFTWH
uniref:SRCR domain-containing protein n=1 Tax=Angiostrongylus cantonensis TaxID=6313 RepID=A0A0K0D9Q2_ANGCA